MTGHAPIGIDDDLAARDACITLGAAGEPRTLFLPLAYLNTHGVERPTAATGNTIRDPEPSAR